MSVAEASLVITVLNESTTISAFLDSLRGQTTLPAEIVIVDGGSTDGTTEAIRTWAPPHGVTVTLIESPGAGISAGRNQAIAAARHDRILVTDAGTEVDPGWVTALLHAASSHDADVVSGFFYPVGDTLLQRAIAFTITPALAEIDPERFLPSSRSISFTREAWAAVGGYPEWLDYCEDLLFDIAMKDAGFVLLFEPAALVSWSARPTLRAFMKQYYRYARGDGKAGLWRKRHFARYVAYTAGLTLAVLSLLTPWTLVALAVCAAAYLEKFWRRVFGRRKAFGRGVVPALALVPLIVIAGDLAKMAGYPAGLRWRSRQPA
ncbi:glycosyltransferase [Microbacterium sp. MYb62]|uniref:glycosyltransferase n=1 Tax=Microbacterium sp. MYb62 TaxID=1848690 RepID=UPI000CFB4CB4|nr:glycosyltransferase [Microbacterium sp. MYb62]PRB07838.1 glycosyl transferase family 2 [Microbacterium sp. MYb62]